MAWTSSTRTSRLPGNWGTIRAKVLDRDGHQCVARMRDGSRCPTPATEVDHIVPNDNHDQSNLQSLCAWHHKRKTASESSTARKRSPRDRRARPTEAHPGLK